MMQFLLEVDASTVSLTALLSLLYSFADAGARFTADDAGKTLRTQLDGTKLLSTAQYTAVTAVPYKLSFAAPPVAAN